MQFDSEAVLGAVGLVLAEHGEETRALIDAQRCAVLEQLEQLEQRLETLPEPAPGEPGRDGTDKIVLLPRHIGAADAFAANDIAWHNGGIWQAVRNGIGDPSRDPAGWKCLVPGISAIETREDFATRELIFGFRMSDGTLHESRSRMPAGFLPADYAARGWGVIAGDIVRDGDFDRQALRDNPSEPADWTLREVRGRRGRDGKSMPGEPGRPGPGLIGLTLARDAQTARLVIVPTFADPAVKAEPVAIDLLTEEPEATRHIIRTFCGAWRGGKSYGRGDVVRHNGALMLSLRPDNDQAPADGAPSWERML
jgi:hypothetical protein